MDMVKQTDQAEEQITQAEEEVQEEIVDVVEEEGGDDAEEPEDDLNPEEAAEEAEEELQAAAQEAVASDDPPAVAIAKALDTWAASLSPTSQQSLQTKNRLGSLKDLVGGSLEKAASAVQDTVQQAVKDWRAENEETLLKSQRFAKKNFDQLEQLVPQIAGALMKKTNESGGKLTRGTIRKSVYRYLKRAYWIFSFDQNRHPASPHHGRHSVRPALLQPEHNQ